MKIKKSYNVFDITRTDCRYCKSNDLTCFMDLGFHPPSNSFILKSQIKREVKYPLRLFICNKCSLVQLLDVVPGELIFDDYLYLSSTSKALKNHYKELVNRLIKRFSLKSNDLVIDIGCNDGVLLRGYKNTKVSSLGVEPSNVADIAIKNGYKVINDFFTPNIAREILKDFGMPKIITATNVFVHVDDMDNFIKSFKILTGEGSVIVIEVSYLIDLIDKNIFDTVYHEHLCYLSLTPLVKYLKKFKLEVFDVERLSFGASGPAIRVFIQELNGKEKISNNVSKMLKSEQNWGVNNLEKYNEFKHKVETIKNTVNDIISEKKKIGIKIGGYGAPAKGNTLLNYFNLNEKLIDCIADTNPLKQGKVTPGSHIPVVSERSFLEKKFDFALLLTWNYLDFFLKNSDYIKDGGKFIVPIPKPTIKPSK